MANPITARAIVAETHPGAGERKGATMGIKRILVVDDSATERHMLKDMLTKAGYDVLSSENGEDAIAKARLLKPDLILMDVVMPGLNGFQATRAISRDPLTKSTTPCRLPRMLTRPRNQPLVSGTVTIGGTAITSPASGSRTSQNAPAAAMPSRDDSTCAAVLLARRDASSCWNERRSRRAARDI